MPILKVANVHHDASGFTRTQISAANTYKVFTSDIDRLSISSTGDITIANSAIVNSMNVVPTIQAAYDKANAANLLAFNTGVGANSYASAVGVAANSYANTLSVLGKQTIFVPATSMIPQITNGAAYGQLEMATNRNMISFLAFDSTTSEGAQFSIQMPKSWNEGNVIGQFVWTHPTGTSAANSVVWSIRSVARANNETLDVAFGAYSNAAANGGTANALYTSPETGNVVVSTASVAEEYVTFQINRQPANAGDTMGVDAYLLGVKIHYTIDAAKDN